MESLTYGTLPERDAFIAATAEHFPYPMGLVIQEEVSAVAAAVNQGIDAHLEIVDCAQFDDGVPHFPRWGLTIKDAGSMHTLIRRLIKADTEMSCEEGSPHDLCSCILSTLDYEWV